MWSLLKQLLPTDRDTCVVIEDGEPKYVILRFGEYQQLKKGIRYSRVEAHLKDRSRDVLDEEAVNRTIEAELESKDFEEPRNPKSVENEGLRSVQAGRELSGILIEDLPF